MTAFDQLGLSDALAANAAAAGFDAPSEVQRAMIPVLRRGGNAIIQAASGSGITAAYALALLDRFATAEGTRVLVIVPTADRAERAARTIALLAKGTSVRVAALTSAWSAASGATILVAAADKLLAAVTESQVKLADIEAVVVDGAAAIDKLGGADTLERIFTSLPKEGQRIFISADMTDALRKVAEAHARKAIHFPPRAAVEQPASNAEANRVLKYVVAPEDRKADKIARLARDGGGPISLVCRSTRAAQNAERELSARGFDVHAAPYAQFDRSQVSDAAVFAFDVPFTAGQLTSAFRNGDILVCERDELTHLKNLASEANVALQVVSLPAYEPDALNAFRNEIRRAAREEDLEAALLVLEPLFDELSAEEIAAAACALLRSRRPAKSEATPAARPGIKTWSRLFLSVGERDGVRPADIVGAITGESGIRGDEVGKVEIRDTFSVVEVVSTAADRVIKSMNGTTMKNRSLRVDYDRKTAPGTRRARPQDKRPGPRAPTRRER